MQSRARARRLELVEFTVAASFFALVTVILTHPLAFRLGSIGYRLADPGDAQYSVWNVAWVAHALLTDPLHVLDANIFHPDRGTLIYSEANLVAGALAVPVYWWTRNPFAAHNSVLLVSFVLSGLGTYYLVRYLFRDRRAAALAGLFFAFCPYVFSHLPHIQLLMTAGIPFSLLAFHRLADTPTFGRAVALGLAMALQALACAYYGVFVALLIAAAVVVTAFAQTRWRDRSYWRTVAAAAAVAASLVLPLFLHYLNLQRDTGFTRSLADADRYSATWRSYLTSAAYTARWLHDLLPPWQPQSDVLFPGYLTVSLGLAGAAIGWRLRSRARYVTGLYGSIALVALWQSLGPAAGLYSATYAALPVFSFLRAPARFGILVTLALAVLAALAFSHLLQRISRPNLATALTLFIAVGLRLVPINWGPVPSTPDAYYVLAEQPRGAVVELPFYSRHANLQRTRYMLNSTVHWMPLVNAYSDIIPSRFSHERDVIGAFPTEEAFRILARDNVRYAVFHLSEYTGERFEELTAKLAEFHPYLERVYGDNEIWLYRIVEYPQGAADGL